MDVLLDHGPVVDDVFLTVGQVAERHVGAHAHLTAHVRHERPDEAAPHDDGAFVNGLRLVGHEGGFIDDVRDAGALAGRAGATTVEGEILCSRRLDLSPAFGADDRLHGGYGKGGLDVMPVGAPVARQARKHEAQAVEQLAHRAEGAADAGHAGTLVQCERGGHVAHVVHVRPFCLRHTPARVGGKGFEVAA